jgi:threonine/homoserine/homoserine lactone efflux protein
MAKALTIMGMVVAVLIFCLFALDLAIGTPFEKANMLMDIGAVICALMLGYLSWSTFREQT